MMNTTSVGSLQYDKPSTKPKKLAGTRVKISINVTIRTVFRNSCCNAQFLPWLCWEIFLFCFLKETYVIRYIKPVSKAALIIIVLWIFAPIALYPNEYCTAR